MLKKTIQFENYNGEIETDDFYFHMSEADLARLELGKGGMSEYIDRIVKAGDGEEIIAMFEKFIAASYGKRSIDGRKFTKSPAILEEFTSSGAYNKFFVQLVTDAAFGAEFVKGIMPAELLAKAEAQQALQANPGISQNLAAHLEVVPEPQLTAEQFQGQAPVAPIVDETVSVQQAPSNKNQSKKVLISKMKIKQGQAVEIDLELLDALTQPELEQAMGNGSTLV